MAICLECFSCTFPAALALGWTCGPWELFHLHDSMNGPGPCERSLKTGIMMATSLLSWNRGSFIVATKTERINSFFGGVGN